MLDMTAYFSSLVWCICFPALKLPVYAMLKRLSSVQILLEIFVCSIGYNVQGTCRCFGIVITFFLSEMELLSMSCEVSSILKK